MSGIWRAGCGRSIQSNIRWKMRINFKFLFWYTTIFLATVSLMQRDSINVFECNNVYTSDQQIGYDIYHIWIYLPVVNLGRIKYIVETGLA